MPSRCSRPLASGWLAFVLGFGSQAVLSDEAAAVDPHAMHRLMMAGNRQLSRSAIDYKVPATPLMRDDGRTVSLVDELADGRPVVLNFIYTTCTTICPMSSQVFSLLQEKLGAERSRVHLVSISIDPEQDTPARLREYAGRFHAGDEWRHYTGTVQASVTVQQAFGAYRGDKMAHSPLTLVRRAGDGPWIRLDGFASADEILAELHGSDALVAAH